MFSVAGVPFAVKKGVHIFCGKVTFFSEATGFAMCTKWKEELF
jgi:hypothetical protein